MTSPTEIQLIQRLPEGPLDIIGDVHGEIDALRNLITRLGGDPDKLEVARPLVFVGDLVDRGPDSPAVLRLVRALVNKGVAFCVAGNHEFNILAEKFDKEGNGWFTGRADYFQTEGVTKGVTNRVPFSSVTLNPDEVDEMRSFLSSLPIALERDDLRVIHACWDQESIDQLPTTANVATLEKSHDLRLQAQISDDLKQRRESELTEFKRMAIKGLKPTRLLTAFIEVEVIRNRNPITRLLSGFEEPIIVLGDQKWEGGKWRHLVRSDWPKNYTDTPAVIVGHYWRKRKENTASERGWRTPDPYAWSGPRGNVFCVDYSVGRRYKERYKGVEADFENSLAAMRWPERVLVFEDREKVYPTTGFGGALD